MELFIELLGISAPLVGIPFEGKTFFCLGTILYYMIHLGVHVENQTCIIAAYVEYTGKAQGNLPFLHIHCHCYVFSSAMNIHNSVGQTH